jgi:CBS domain-containing protein
MDSEGLTSVAVVDNGLNVVGNISTFDVKLLTSAASAPLLHGTCMHFVSVILSEKGVEHGRDSFPVFYVTPHSTLAHTVAKLVATHSHRMWIVESPSPSPSAPATPLLTPSLPTSASGETTTAPGATVVVPPLSAGSAPPSPMTGSGGAGFASVPAAALPGMHLSGRLTGVVSLTDILNLFAKSSGLHPADPGDQRERRRTQSSSSSVRPSLDGVRTSSDVRK